jgi:hypothetical protein
MPATHCVHLHSVCSLAGPEPGRGGSFCTLLDERSDSGVLIDVGHLEPERQSQWLTSALRVVAARYVPSADRRAWHRNPPRY